MTKLATTTIVRRLKVAELLAREVPLAEIADECMVSTRLIGMDIRYIRAKWLEQYGTAYDQFIATDLAKLVELEKVLWPDLGSDNPATRRLAIDRLLSILERRAALLGLDAPKKQIVQVLDTHIIQTRVEELRHELARQQALEAG